MSLLSFNHLLHLSFAWHTHRNTGEVLKILDRGAAINNAFQVLRPSIPLYDTTLTFPDSFWYLMSSRHLLISLSRSFSLRSSLIGYLQSSLSSSWSHMVSSSGLVNLSCPSSTRSVVASVVLTRWRTRLRRTMNERDRVRLPIHSSLTR